ncbi:bH2015 protein [Clostridium sp. CAG:433]|nr:bH2015 protein [Clostridium sp. CAG:433]
MLKKIVSLIIITISSFFIINNFKEVKDYDDNVDLLIEKNNINRKYDGYISFKNKKWLIKYGDYNEILNQNLVLMISNKETLESEYGNIILAGHNNKYVFSNLYKLNINDEIIVSDFNYEYLFKVYDISKVNIKNKSILDNVYDKKILTLITCTSNNQIRYVVTAKYIHTISHN